MKKKYGIITISPENTIMRGKDKRICVLCVCECGYQWYKDKRYLDKIFNCIRCYQNRDRREFLAGERFGKLTSTGIIKIHPTRGKLYSFLCDCGKHTFNSKDQITGGIVFSCGNHCKIKMEATEVKEGQRFGQWTVLSGVTRSPYGKGGRVFEVRCDCGKIGWRKANHIKLRSERCNGCPLEAEKYLLKPGEQYGEWTVTGNYKFFGTQRKFEVICSCKEIYWRPKTGIVKSRTGMCRDCFLKEVKRPYNFRRHKTH